MIYKVEDLFLHIRNGMNIKQQMDAGGLPITRIETIANAEINLELVGRADITKEQARNYLLEDGEILFSHINSVSHIGKCALYTKDMGELVHGMNLLSFKPNQVLLYPKYALYALRSHQFKDQLVKSIKKAVNQASVSIGDIKNITLNVPPLAEQKRIAAILDKATEIKTKREQAIARHDELKQSIFIEMFGDGYTNKKWEYKRLGNCCSVKGGKRLPKGEEYSSKPTKHRYIRVTNIKKGIVDEANLLYLNEETFKKISRYIVNDGDVIISIAGSIGVTAPITKSLDGVNLTENAAKLTPIFKQILDNQFLSELLQTKKIQDQINANVGQVVISKLALFRIESLEIPVPPFELQLKFSNLIKEISKNKLRLIKSNIKTTKLIQSLQYQAFTTGFNA